MVRNAPRQAAQATTHFVDVIYTDQIQKTLQRKVKVNGQALHLGGLSSLLIEPAAENTGIVFSYADTTVREKHSTFVYSGTHTTSVVVGHRIILGVEHLLSALNGLGITNACIRFIQNSECPIGDGSAQTFV